MRLTVFVGWMLLSASAWAQVSTARAALVRLQKKDYAAARSLLTRAMRKEAGAGHYYVWAHYFATPGQLFTQLDSAHAHTQRAMQRWEALSPAEREAFARFPLDSTLLHDLQTRIDSLAFERAQAANTEESYRFFLHHFSTAAQRPRAVELASEIRFLQALRQNTTEAYRAFLADYPGTARTVDATDRLDQLVYAEETRSGRLSDIVRFYHAHPGSRFRPEALTRIFQMQTAAGRATDFHRFLNQYPGTPSAAHAAALVFYLDSGRRVEEKYWPDSLRELARLNEGFWIPFLRDGQYGFLNHRGEVALAERFFAIPMNYRCEPITTDFITADQHLYLRNGRPLTTRPVQAVEELGAGFVLLHTAESKTVLHKTGFTFLHPVENARVVGGRFLAIQQRGRWGLQALNGLDLLPRQFEAIEYMGNTLVLHQNGKKVLMPLRDAVAVAEGHQPALDLVFDEVKPWHNSGLWVKNGSLEGVLSADLRFQIPLGRHRLHQTVFGHLQITDGMTATVGLGGEVDGKKFRSVRVAEPWVVLRESEKFSLYGLLPKKVLSHGLDSIWFAGRNAWGKRNDSTFLYSATRTVVGFPGGTTLELVSSADSIRSFILADKSRKAVYRLDNGRRLFSATFEKITQAGRIFIITEKNRKGLLDETGRALLPAEYDDIVFQPPFFFSIVKAKLFGGYDAAAGRLIKPAFDRAVQRLPGGWLVAGKEGKKGVLRPDGLEALSFEWDEVMPWSDSLLWVQKSGWWKLVNVVHPATVLERVRAFRVMAQRDTEKLVWIKRDAGEGVFSSQLGEIIPSTFSEVYNAGTEEQPLFVAGREIREAGMVVVVYFDRTGKRLRKQAYEEEEWDRLLCDE